jgi:hypothetical protein
MNKLVRLVIAVFACGLFAFAGFQIRTSAQRQTARNGASKVAEADSYNEANQRIGPLNPTSRTAALRARSALTTHGAP